ncbi:MAG: hypothetical protein L6R45_33705 [Anaerolineae bacterium]|nr:hypothetical protein [Anaerolineae bacterium]
MQKFFRNLGNLILSLFLATLVWVAAVREENPPRTADYPQAIPIQVIPPAAGLVTTDKLPETVRLRLLAPESSWSTLSVSKFKATVDLSSLAEGFNDVPVRVSVSDSQIKIVEQIPKEVSINLQAVQTISLPVNVMVMDEPPIGFINRAPIANPARVTITGPASLVSQVDEAISEIFIGNTKETISRLSDVVVRNRDDQPLSNLKIEPARVQITLPIEQRFGYKDVSVSAVISGQPAPGYWVSNILVNPPRLTIVGNPQALSSISGFVATAPINVNQATADIVQSAPLNLPNGVTVVLPDNEGGGASGVQVTVEIAAIESGQTVQRPITQQGIDPDYVWTASPERADVIISGPIPRLQTLKPEDVKVVVDLFGLSPGAHKVHPTVFLPEELNLEAILPDTIEIIINPNPRLNPTPVSPVPTPTPTRTPSPTSTATPKTTPTDKPRPNFTPTPDEG